MRTKHICPKCDHREILYVTQIADAIGHYENPEVTNARPLSQHHAGLSKPMRIARVPNKAKSFWNSANGQLSGVLRAYVCRACGYTEFYTELPETIPVDEDLVRLLKGPPKEPYR